MLKLRTKQHIRFAKLDQGTAWVVVAVLIETVGTETIAISEPKIVKIIPKTQQYALSGNVAKNLTLAAPISAHHAQPSSVISPYISTIFGYADSNFIVGLAPLPPTK